MGNAVFGFTAGALCDFCVIPCLFGLSEIFHSHFVSGFSVTGKGFNNNPDLHCDDKWLLKRFRRGDLKIRANSSHFLKDSKIIDVAFGFNEDLFWRKRELSNNCEFDAQLCPCRVLRLWDPRV